MPGRERNLEIKAVERARVEQLRAALGIAHERLVARGYADLPA